MSTRVEYKDADGNTRTFTPERCTLHEHLFEESRAEIAIPQDEWAILKDRIDRRNDEWRVYDADVLEHAGRLADIEDRTHATLVTVGDWEEDARDAEPTDPVHRFENAADDTIAKDAISKMPTLSEGTVEQTTASISKLFNRASPAGMLRSLARATGAEVRYNPDKSVDYVDQLGTDKTGKDAQILSEAAQTVAELTVARDAREEPTHILVLGAGEGDAQIAASSTHKDYSEGDREVWRQHKDKEITNQSEAQSLADELMSEVESAPRHVELDAHDVDIFPPPQLGDTYPVQDAERGLSIDARVTGLEWDLTRDIVSLQLTNRPLTVAQERARDQRQLEQFTGGFQGLTVPVNDTPISRQPVDASTDAVGHVRYPDDVVQELDAILLVEGLPYRAYSGGAASSDTGEWLNYGRFLYGVRYTEDGDGNLQGEDNIVDGSTDDVWADVDVVTSPTGTFQGANVTVQVLNNTGSSQTNGWELKNLDTGETLDSGTFSVSQGALRTQNVSVDTTEVSAGDTLRFEITSGEVGTQANAFWLGGIEMIVASKSSHTHDPDPGIVETFDGTTHYPENVDVEINGSSLGLSLGDGTDSFQEEVDISDELSEGFNEIRIKSDALGHVRASLYLDLFRQVTAG